MEIGSIRPNFIDLGEQPRKYAREQFMKRATHCSVGIFLWKRCDCRDGFGRIPQPSLFPPSKRLL